MWTGPMSGSTSCGPTPRSSLRSVLDQGRGGRTNSARSVTSSSAPASPASTSSTSVSRRCASAASTGAGRGRAGRVASAPRGPRASTSAGSGSRARTSSPSWSTGGPRWPSPSTGRRAATRWDWSCAAISPPRARRIVGSRTSGSGPRAGRTAGPATRPAAHAEGVGREHRGGRSTAISSSGAPAPSWPRSKGPGPGSCATSWPPSSGSRTRSSALRSRASWSSRAARAPERRPWPCTGPHTFSIRTGSPSSARASW